MTLAEWLIEEYGNNKAWKAGTDKQIKNMDVQKVLNAIGREALFLETKELESEDLIYVKRRKKENYTKLMMRRNWKP